MNLLRLGIELSILFSVFNLLKLRNPIHIVFGLIGIYFLSAILLLCLNTEFFSFILIIINVGAIGVLFLCVIIMLELKEVKTNFLPFSLINYTYFFLFFYCIIYFFSFFFDSFSLSYIFFNTIYTPVIFFVENSSDVFSISKILYTHYIFAIMYAGLLLLLAILGATTLVHKIDQKKINI